MNLFLKILSVAILSTIFSQAVFAWFNIHPVITVGNGNSTANGTQNIWLATTPEPGLENTYKNDGPQSDTLLLGFALEKNFSTSLKNIESVLSVEMDYLKNQSMTGTVYPMVNVAPDFDTLNFSYHMKSYLLLATAKVNILNILPYLGAYLQGGLGGAINQLTDYSETTSAASSAAPMLAPFGNASQTQFAFSLGAGFLFQVSKPVQVLLGYRYINSGAAGFKTSPIQQTNSTIRFSSLSHHFFTVSIII